MRVLHVSFSYPPDPPGGTELYIESLCRQLAATGSEVVIAAPAASNARYRHEGLEVRRFAIGSGAQDLRTLYGAGDDVAAAQFDRILRDVQPDVVHQHALSPACSALLVRAAKQRAIPVVFTYHTPTVSCQRGSLLEFGRTPCDGRVAVDRCSACTLQGLGVGESASRLLSRVPGVLGNLLGRTGLSGGAWTALQMTDLMRVRAEHLTGLVNDVDLFVSLTPWIKGVLRRNGVPDQKIVSSAHGIAVPRIELMRSGGDGQLRVAHLGRLDPVKGTRLLIDAVRSIPASPISLDIFGVVQGEGDAQYRGQLQAAAGGDQRIRFRPAIEHRHVIDTLGQYDVVAVPSQWLETGPLVVLEAFAAGVPVIGSALGGIPDKVTDGVNGLLVTPHGDAAAWAAALHRCATEPAVLARLRRGVRPPRSVADVAAEMTACYRGLAQPRLEPARVAR